ncbi:hypothetical protein [Streptosporangium sp. NPDC051022]|uniref:hypothetical protein n=1 Tax=Streptosporangium sp. NPDC051022 TaxID=3155752 RepID=UPI00342F6C36
MNRASVRAAVSATDGTAADGTAETGGRNRGDAAPGRFATVTASAWARSGTRHGPPGAPARGAGSDEDAIQTVPFLVGSSVILLAVVLVFRGTLDADRRLERSRRYRLRQRLERSTDGRVQPARGGEERPGLDTPEHEAGPGTCPDPTT